MWVFFGGVRLGRLIVKALSYPVTLVARTHYVNLAGLKLRGLLASVSKDSSCATPHCTGFLDTLIDYCLVFGRSHLPRTL